MPASHEEKPTQDVVGTHKYYFLAVLIYLLGPARMQFTYLATFHIIPIAPVTIGNVISLRCHKYLFLPAGTAKSIKRHVFFNMIFHNSIRYYLDFSMSLDVKTPDDVSFIILYNLRWFLLPPILFFEECSICGILTNICTDQSSHVKALLVPVSPTYYAVNCLWMSPTYVEAWPAAMFQNITLVVPGGKALVLGSNWESFSFEFETTAYQPLQRYRWL